MKWREPSVALVAPLAIPVVFGDDYSGATGPLLLLLPGALGYGAMRMFSNALVASSAPGLSSAGPLVALAGQRATIVGCGVVMLVASLAALLVPSIRDLRREPARQPEPAGA